MNAQRGCGNDRDAPGAIRYHVVLDGSRWLIQREGLSREEARWVLEDAPTIDSREKAVARAKELAQRHEFACVIVHAADGSVEEEIAYGIRL